MNTAQGFAVIGDSHIVADDDQLKLTGKHDGLFSLRQTIDWCLANSYDLVIAGDLFDKNLVPSHLLREVVQILERLTVGGRRLLGIQGNHDKNPSYPWFMHVPGAEWLTLRPTEVAGHQLVGLDFAPSALISQQLTEVPPCDGLILHQALQQGLGFDGAWNCDLDWVPEHAPNVWIGDLHNIRTELRSSSKKVRAVYTTSQYLTKVDESEAPSFLAVPALKPGHQGFAPYQRIPLAHRPIHRFRLESQEQVDQMIDDLSMILLDKQGHLPEGVRRPGLVVTYYSDLVGVVEVLRTLTEGFSLAAVHEVALPSRQTSFATGRITVQAREGVTLQGLLTERVEDGPFRRFVLDLASCRTVEEVRQTLTHWQDQILNPKEVAQ